MKHKHGTYVSLSQLVKTTASQIEDAYHQRRPPHTLRYGFHALDEITTGIHPGDFVAVVSDSPVLSTVLLLSTVHSLSVTDGVPIRFISARHDETYLTTQLLSIESGIGIIFSIDRLGTGPP